jgi:general secretion pathway protein F
MPGFRYQAYNVEGKLHKGVLEADSARQARAQLRDQGLTPHRVEIIAANDPAAGARFRPVALSSTQVTQLTRSLASLLEAGLTVEQAFNALIEQAENERVRQVLAALRGEVIAGNTIAKALGSFPNAFPELYRTLVAAGEASGQLPRVLAKLADYLEERHQLRARLTLALIYPAIVMAVALAVVGALLVYVLPQVVQVFQHAHQQLPVLTRALIASPASCGRRGRCGSAHSSSPRSRCASHCVARPRAPCCTDSSGALRSSAASCGTWTPRVSPRRSRSWWEAACRSSRRWKRAPA